MNLTLLYIAAALGAVVGVILMFTLDSLVTGQLFIISAVLFVIAAMRLKKK